MQDARKASAWIEPSQACNIGNHAQQRQQYRVPARSSSRPSYTICAIPCTVPGLYLALLHLLSAESTCLESPLLCRDSKASVNMDDIEEDDFTLWAGKHGRPPPARLSLMRATGVLGPAAGNALSPPKPPPPPPQSIAPPEL